jgi:hypothetical protein
LAEILRSSTIVFMRRLSRKRRGAPQVRPRRDHTG